MADFLLIYRSPADYENAEADVQAWNEWLVGMGGNLLDVGRPVVASDGLGVHAGGLRLTGFSFIAAEDLAAARKMAAGCPALRNGGAVEIGALVAMPEGHGPESG